MRVINVDVTIVEVPQIAPIAPYRSHVRSSSTTMSAIVRVETDAGLEGWGEHNVNFLPEISGARMQADARAWLVGRDPTNLQAYHRDCRLETRLKSGIELALWDIKGKALGQPVYRLLGDYSPDITTYCTFGMLEYSRDDLGELASELVAAGWDKLKIKVCIEDSKNIPEDAARVRAVREGAGDAAEIMMDANHLFSPMEALELARMCEPYNVKWFEEPLCGNDVENLKELRASTTIPIAAGQQEGMRWRHRDLIAGGAVDIAQPDVVFVGGYTEGIKVAHLAQAFDVPVATHGWPHLNMHLAGAISNAWRLEYHLGPAGLADHLFTNAPKPENGILRIPDRPGLGLEFNEAGVRPYEDS
ncbi:MAG TPA: mandelate racemase/muconate lactonizing enzyme family protein [Nitrospinae bacterium]|nr:mandelate racemase/muconate lactonizing enzyme family protein [Nitrospinota bacterium]